MNTQCYKIIVKPYKNYNDLGNETNIKVYTMSNGKLCARNRKGKTVAKEQ